MEKNESSKIVVKPLIIVYSASKELSFDQFMSYAKALLETFRFYEIDQKNQLIADTFTTIFMENPNIEKELIDCLKSSPSYSPIGYITITTMSTIIEQTGLEPFNDKMFLKKYLNLR